MYCKPRTMSCAISCSFDNNCCFELFLTEPIKNHRHICDKAGEERHDQIRQTDTQALMGLSVLPAVYQYRNDSTFNLEHADVSPRLETPNIRCCCLKHNISKKHSVFPSSCHWGAFECGAWSLQSPRIHDGSLYSAFLPLLRPTLPETMKSHINIWALWCSGDWLWGLKWVKW